MYAWETAFRDLIFPIRKKEVKKFKKIFILEAFSTAVASFSQVAASFFIYWTYYLRGEELTVGKFYAALFLMGFLRVFFLIYLLFATIFLAEASLLFKRVHQIL